MKWQLNVVGTPDEVGAAIDTIPSTGPFTNSEQMLLVKQVLHAGFDNSYGEVSELMYDGPLQLKAYGNLTYTSFSLHFDLQLVRLDEFGKVISSVPLPINTATVPLPPP